MKIETLHQIVLCAEKQTKKELKKENVYTSVSDKYNSLLELEYSDSIYDKIKGYLITGNLFSTIVKSIMIEEMEISQKTKMASKLFNISKDKITGDLEKLSSPINNIRIFVNDFQYDGSVSLDKLSKLNVIWGDTNLEKLHDFKYLKSLRVVMGDLYIGNFVNEDSISKLKVVTGDLHIENLNNTDLVDNMIYVGGNIYLGNEVKTLDEIKSKGRQYIRIK